MVAIRRLHDKADLFQVAMEERPRRPGMGSHQARTSGSDTWFTPRWILDALGGAESFDLDPCSDERRPWPTALQHYTRADNGLLLPWFGRVWLNPPYSPDALRGFLGRMVEHGRGIALTFARTETETFQRLIWPHASGILFLAGRITFVGVDGRYAQENSGAPSVLISYGEADRSILAATAALKGKFLELPR